MRPRTSQILSSAKVVASVVAATLLSSCLMDDTAFGPQDLQAFESSVSGRVTDTGGRALSGALVTLLPVGATTVSGPDGSFALNGLREGSYRLAVAKDDYRDTLRLDSISLGLSVGRDVGKIGICYRYATVMGVVEDSTGNPVPSAGVAVENQGSTATTTSGGAFALAKVEPGRVRLFSAVQDVGYGVLDTVLRADQTLRGVRFRITRRGGVVTGQVVDGSGQGIWGAEVHAMGGAPRTTTVSNGTFRLTGVPADGRVALEIGKGDLSLMVTGVKVAESGNIDLGQLVLRQVSSAPVSIRAGLAIADATESVVALVAKTASSDTTFRIWRYVWSLDGGATWDSTALNFRSVRLASTFWSGGANEVKVQALAIDGRRSPVGSLLVRLASPANSSAVADSTFGAPWNSSVSFGVLHDARDGRSYRTVRIGEQTWMAENLNFVADSSWWYDNNSDSGAKYGSLYQWASAMGLSAHCNVHGCANQVLRDQRGVCPADWHIPSDSEWMVLRNTVDASNTTAGSRLKSTSGWSSRGNGTDLFGFRALPAGYHVYDGSFFGGGDNAYFLSASESDSTNAWYWSMGHGDQDMYRNNYGYKTNGFSVRCLKN